MVARVIVPIDSSLEATVRERLNRSTSIPELVEELLTDWLEQLERDPDAA